MARGATLRSGGPLLSDRGRFRWSKPAKRWALGVVLLTGLLPASATASHSQLELISTGPGGGNAAIGALLAGTSTDGSRAFFETTESLVASDSDSCPLFTPPRPCFDVYERAGATTTMLSTGPSGGNGDFDARFAGASANGTRVYFGSAEPLTPQDTDNMCQGPTGLGPCGDIYERVGGTTSLVSTGPERGNGPFDRYFATPSDDGTRLLFGATDGLTGADSDQSEDLYERAGGVTALVSAGTAGGNGAFDSLFSGASADVTHVFFRTSEPLVGSDTDGAGDVYERFGGTTALVSTGPTGGNGSASSAYEGSSRDGSKVFFSTEEALVAADTDGAEDIYQRSGGTTTLVSTGPSGNGSQNAIFAGTSTDGARVFFRTRSSLVGADGDSSVDLYERSAGSTALVSAGTTGGNGAFDVNFAAASDDGTRVFFTTKEGLTAADTDGRLDIYERSAGSTALVSAGTTGGNGAFDTYLADVSADGSRVFFTTDESLVAGDADSLQDIYERQGTATTLVSTGPNGGNGAHAAFFAEASDDGTRVFFHTGEKLVSGDTDASLDVYASRALTGYARPRGASPTLVRLVPAYEPCNSPNGSHGPPLAVTSCSPPDPSSAHLTVGTPDSNGQPVKLEGHVTIKAICSPPAPGTSPPCTEPGEQGDVEIEFGITDIRRQGDLSDYAGELQSVLVLRTTDRLNGNSLTDPATASDVPFSIPVPCMPNTDATVGSSCNLTTTADAVLAGMVFEGKRTVWGLGEIEVRDGGADGDADTGPNTPFLQQGLFAP